MGDYNIASYTLTNTPYYLFLDEPLTVFGHWKSNTTEQLHFFKTSMPEYKEWIEWIKQNYLQSMPYKEYLWPNCVAATLRDMKKRLGLPWDINDVQYYFSIIQEVIFLELRNIDVEAQKEAAYRTFHSLPLDLKQKIIRALNNGMDYSIQNNLEVISLSNQGITFNKNEKAIEVKGTENNFNNIFEAGHFFEKFLKNKVFIQKSKEESGDSRELIEYIINGLSCITHKYKRLFIISDNTPVLKICFERFKDHIAGIGNAHFLMKGMEIMPGIFMHDINEIRDIETDCIVVMQPDYPLPEDTPHKMFSDFIRYKVQKYKKNIHVITYEDIQKIGFVISMLNNNVSDIKPILELMVETIEDMVQDGHIDMASNIIQSLLEVIDNVKGTLLNDLGVILAQQGEIDRAIDILKKAVSSEYKSEEARRNLEMLYQLR